MTFGTNCYVVQDGKLTVGQRLTAGAFAGMSAVAVTHPLDVIRLRLSLPHAGYTGVSPAVFTSYYSASRCLLGVNLTMARALHHTLLMAGMTNALVTIMRTEGSFALYKGFAPALIGTAPFAALNFASYDLLKKYFFDLDVRFAPPPPLLPFLSRNLQPLQWAFCNCARYLLGPQRISNTARFVPHFSYAMMRTVLAYCALL